MDLDAAADALYALPPSEFVAARGERSKEARAAGDGELAAAITKLRKPTVAAWLANLLVRQRADDVGRLIELGDQLRAAQRELAGDTLRTLSMQRRESVGALRTEGVALGLRAGVAVGENAAGELEATLEAAVADPKAAEMLRAGRLAYALRYAGTGFDGLALDVSPTPAPARPAPASARGGVARSAKPKPPTAARRAAPAAAGQKRKAGVAKQKAQPAAKQRAEAAARRKAEVAALREAESAEKESARRVSGATKKVDDARGRLRAARTALERARSEVDRLKREAAACEKGMADADRLLHKAEGDHKAACRRLEQLQHSTRP